MSLLTLTAFTIQLTASPVIYLGLNEPTHRTGRFRYLPETAPCWAPLEQTTHPLQRLMRQAGSSPSPQGQREYDQCLRFLADPADFVYVQQRNG